MLTYPRALAAVVLAGLPAIFAQSTVNVPSTGSQTTGANDAHWTVTANSLSGESTTGAAAIVTKLPSGWITPDAGTAWIAPQADQSNATRSGNCCVGQVTYRVTFNVTDPATAVFQLKIAADEDLSMYLNAYDTNHLVYSSDGSTYNSPVSIRVKQGATYIDPDHGTHLVQFVPGLNTIIIDVGNLGGGPTGLYISATPAPPPVPTVYSSTAPAFGSTYAVGDPVDSGTGQFYDTAIDFQLGGPMDIGFARFYGSQLSKSGVVSALGTNWMSTYDVSALVNDTKAQVLLFGGRVATFNNSGGSWKLVSPTSRGYQFATVGAGFQFMDPDAQSIYTFSSVGVLTKIEDRNGNAITVTAGSSGPSKVSDGLGRTLTFAYSSGNLVSVQDQSGRVTSFAYASGLLASVTDSVKNITNYSYVSSGSLNGLLSKETLPMGNAPVAQTYDSSGRAITQTGTVNNTTKIAYDGLGGTTITDPAGNITKHKNDDIGALLQLTDALGNTATVNYDGLHLRTSATDRTGATVQYVMDSQTGFPSAATDANGNTTGYTLSPQTKGPFTFWDVAGISYADGNSATLTYDPNGNLISSTLPDGAAKTYTYDSHGNLTQSTDKAGNSTGYTWNTDGTLASIQDGIGNSSSFEYDALKRVVKSTDANGVVKQMTYDANGRETSMQPQNQLAWQLHYNANGQIDSATNPLAGQWAYTYSTAEAQATATDPLKNVITTTYDNQNQPSKVQNGAGEALIYTRDALGRVSAAADNSGPLFQYQYNGEGRMTSQKDAAGLATLYSYTPSGQLATISTPTGNTTAFSYDARGNLTAQTNPMGDQTIQTFDAMGRLMSVSQGGSSTSFQRDFAGMPVSFTTANGNVWNFAYDPLERISTSTDPAGNATNFLYQGTRLVETDFPLGSLQYSYNTQGLVTKAEYSDGTVIHTGYNGMGQITSSDGVAIDRDLIGQISKVNGIAITRDAAGRPLTMTYAPGKVIRYTYDKSGRVDSVVDWNGGKTLLSYDAASRRASQQLPNGVVTSYGFDAEGRRNSITYGELGSIALTFDANGKVSAADRNVPLAPVIQDSADTLSTATYDSMGRVMAQGARTFQWNLASQLVAYSDPVNSGSMTYDGLGELSSSNAQSFVFNYAMEFPSLSIARQDGSDQRYYVYLPNGELLYSIEAADQSRHFYHFDEMGNTAFLTGDDGGITDTYAITPYGEIADHIGATDNPFTWQGQYGAIREGDGLYFLRSRHYDAATGRFLSRDPVMNADPQSSEPYTYARGNPMLYTDPYGAWPWDGIVAAVSNTVKAVAKVVTTVVTKIFSSTPAPVVKPVVKTVVKSVPPAAPVVLKPPTLPALAGVQIDQAKVLAQSKTGGLTAKPPAKIISDNSEGIISQDGNSVVSNDGGTIISDNSEGIISQDGNSVISNDGGTFTLRVSAYKLTGLTTAKPKSNKK